MIWIKNRYGLVAATILILIVSLLIFCARNKQEGGLINEDLIVSGQIIDFETGEVRESEEYRSYDGFIPVKGGETLFVTLYNSGGV